MEQNIENYDNPNQENDISRDRTTEAVKDSVGIVRAFETSEVMEPWSDSMNRFHQQIPKLGNFQGIKIEDPNNV